MPIFLAGSIEFVHIEQVSALFTFHFEQVLLWVGVCARTFISPYLLNIRLCSISTSSDMSIVLVQS
jgi:hypothetical protein